jgi:uncharacterized membrane protein
MIFLMSLLPFLGRFHPVLVHLPIGILIFAIVIEMVSVKERYKGLRSALPLAYLLGALSAVVSCITGYLLSQEGGYEEALLGQHRWMGIGVAVLSSVLFGLKVLKSPISKLQVGRDDVSGGLFGRFSRRFSGGLSGKIMLAMSVVLLVLISITGHLGGSLTHGKDYLTEYSPFQSGASDTPVKRVPITNVPQAQVYRDIVAPILQDKCRGCHNMSKQKGGLRMDDFVWLMKGGKHGVVVAPGDTSGSVMMKRIRLATGDEKHMPPIDKEQLTKPEIALLNWWIDKGAAAEGTVAGTDSVRDKSEAKTGDESSGKSGEKTGEVVQLIKVWQEQRFPPARKSIVPEQEVAKADEAAVKALTGKSVVVLAAGANSNYLSVDFVNAPVGFHTLLPLLEKIGPQIVWLQTGGTDIGDADLAAIAAFPHLLRLHLEHTAVTDAGLTQLKNATKLEYLNLVGTGITKEGVKRLAGLKKLKELYLYQTPVTKEQVAEIQSGLPGTAIYAGSYVVPAFAEDTMKVTKPKPAQ